LFYTESPDGDLDDNLVDDNLDNDDDYDIDYGGDDNDDNKTTFYLVTFSDSLHSYVYDVYITLNETIGDNMPTTPSDIIEGTENFCSAHFVGWFNNDVEVTSDTVVTQYILAKAKYNIVRHDYVKDESLGYIDDDTHGHVIYRCQNCGYLFDQLVHYLQLDSSYSDTDEYGHNLYQYNCTGCDINKILPKHIYENDTCIYCGEEKNGDDSELLISETFIYPDESESDDKMDSDNNSSDDTGNSDNSNTDSGNNSDGSNESDSDNDSDESDDSGSNSNSGDNGSGNTDNSDNGGNSGDIGNNNAGNNNSNSNLGNTGDSNSGNNNAPNNGGSDSNNGDNNSNGSNDKDDIGPDDNDYDDGDDFSDKATTDGYNQDLSESDVKNKTDSINPGYKDYDDTYEDEHGGVPVFDENDNFCGYDIDDDGRADYFSYTTICSISAIGEAIDPAGLETSILFVFDNDFVWNYFYDCSVGFEENTCYFSFSIDKDTYWGSPFSNLSTILYGGAEILSLDWNLSDDGYTIYGTFTYKVDLNNDIYGRIFVRIYSGEFDLNEHLSINYDDNHDESAPDLIYSHIGYDYKNQKWLIELHSSAYYNITGLVLYSNDESFDLTPVKKCFIGNHGLTYLFDIDDLYGDWYFEVTLQYISDFNDIDLGTVSIYVSDGSVINDSQGSDYLDYSFIIEDYDDEYVTVCMIYSDFSYDLECGDEGNTSIHSITVYDEANESYIEIDNHSSFNYVRSGWLTFKVSRDVLNNNNIQILLDCSNS
jgi:hypothetical protein